MLTDRIERSKQKYAELFGQTDVSASGTDPDFADILSHFVYGDVYAHGSLTDKQRELITQCMPYVGFPRTLNALNCVNEKS